MDKERRHKGKAKYVRAALLMAALLCVALILLFLFRDTFQMMRVDFEDRHIELEGGETFELRGRRVSRKDAQGGVIWQSPEDYQVQDMIISDITGDGDNELILLLWKKGKFGSHLPFWKEKNEEEDIYSQHLFIYGLDDEPEPRHRWGTSDNGRLIRRMKLYGRDGNMIMVEDVEGDCTLWQWSSWGLKSLESKVDFAAFGDNLIHEAIYSYAFRERHGSFSFLYDHVRDEVRKADLAALQQETMLVSSPSAYGDFPSFGTPMGVGEAVDEAGFDIASCAGNHALDRGITGIDETVAFYRDKDIVTLGVQDSRETEYVPCRYVSKNGIRFALFDYTMDFGGVNVQDRYPHALHYLPQDDAGRERVLSDLAAAGNEADLVIVFVHWGEEYEKEPDEYQRSMAGLFAEGGADVVIGTHPHVIQPCEHISRGDGGQTLVCYSLGNLVADQGSEDTAVGGELTFRAEHTWDGVKITEWKLKEICSYWKKNLRY